MGERHEFMSKLSKTFKLALALLLAVFSTNLVPATAAFAAAKPGTDQPVWCHHTGNHWSVQIGDDNSGDRNDNYPLFMTDALRALVDNKGDEVVDTTISNGDQAYAHDRNAKIDPSFCDAQYPPLAIPTPVVTPICGLKNDGVSVADSPYYTWTFSGWNTATPSVTLIATSPYNFTNGQSTVIISVAESNTATNCSGNKPDDIRETREKSTTICYPGGGGLTTTWTEARTYTYVFNAWTQKWVGFYTPWVVVVGSSHTDNASETACPGPVQVQPTCEVTTGSLTLPAYTQDKFHTYTYEVTIGTTTTSYSAAQDVTITGIAQGESVKVKLVMNTHVANIPVYTHTFTFSYANCIEIPEAPAPTDPCGLDNATWTKPANSDNITWSIDENGHLIATAVDGHFTDGQATHDYGQATDSGVLCETTPEMPRVIDVCYTDRDFLIVPSTEGVVYKVNGDVASRWVPYEGADLVVTAEPTADYTFGEEATTSWTFTAKDFTDQQCLTITKTNKSVSDTNHDGIVGDVGDEVTWTITVTNTSENECEGFQVQVEDPSATLTDENGDATNGYIDYLGAGQSVDFTATTVLTASEVKECKAINTASLLGWRYQPREEVALDRGVSESESEVVNLPLANASITAEQPLTCLQSGKGGGTPSVLQAPNTGIARQVSGISMQSAALILASLVGTLAFGAVYFSRRQATLEK